ncbi:MULTISPECIES: protein translocase subunit SecD [unclassified Lysobacter]|uniref:protein translocase subunit SecD n=1 Tax=unclassified Lysobacter TaxID=2635362 RepID=UPI0006FAC938|nr:MULTISPECIES: protein translocase subunit SecD [unclassified Lysobacter]KQZ59948.1 preprotein translocase subunit SecD [Lysobacter sp. Root559]KRA77177.1 preprotein translocase subunit SecD [Lysobacter sp. Root667]KRC38396.1 preprotein translocase subunit SecD [Lysobacter sp. Root76]KRD71484.1 preprotein translocase subunit SecD [Lysobacter sp. Root96]
MLTYSRWKYLAILVVLLLSALYALPNVFPQDPSVQITSARGAAVDEALRKRVIDTLVKAKVPTKSVAIEKEGNLLVRLTDNEHQIQASDALRDPLGSDYVVALNLASTVPDWLSMLKAKPMLLGLDLQGGVHFLMQVDQKAALDKRLDATAEDVRVSLRDGHVRYESVERRANNSIVATLGNPADAEKARQIVAKSQPLLIQDVSGNTVSIQVPEAELKRMQAEAVEQNVGTLRNRVNALGVAEPIIQRQGSDRIVVQLPGVQDTAQAKRILGATATLEYRGVVEGDAQEALRSGNVPPEARIYYRRETGPDGKPLPILLNKRVIASGDQLVGATAGFDQQTGTASVSIRLNGVGGARMFDYTTEHVGKPMAVVYIERIPEVRMVDGKEVRTTKINEEVINVATINGVFSKEFNTTGLDSSQEASDLALLLRAGSLAAPMDFIEQRIVGPSLGAENVQRGLKAVSFSFAFALIFFLIYYRMFGVITCLALLINLLMVIALMSLFGATMTLPGLAGIALTVGMSVDANVLINERIREELRAGLPPQAAIVSGYEHASGTIIDANVTAFLAGLAMAVFGTGPLRGFGITLMLGIATSAYTAVSVSRGIATLIYGGRRKLKSIAI